MIVYSEKRNVATIKQKKAALEKVKILKGESSIKTDGEMLEKVGYSKGIAKSPNRVTESKGYKEILEQYLPDEMLANTHTELIKDEKPEVRLKSLDLAYKIKGSYAPEKSQTVNLNLNTEIKNSKQSRELVDEYEAKLAKMLKEPKNNAQK